MLRFNVMIFGTGTFVSSLLGRMWGDLTSSDVEFRDCP
jgi:hypothetical protein